MNFKPFLFLDDEQRFAYFQFMNNRDQQLFKVSSNLQVVIIIDTQTNFFNATKLFESISTTNYTLTQYLKSKPFQIASEQIESTITIPPIDNEEEEIEATSESSKYYIGRNKESMPWSGLYLHPNLLGHFLFTINPTLSFTMSSFIFSFFIREGLNKSIDMNKLTKHNNDVINAKIDSYKEKIDLVSDTLNSSISSFDDFDEQTKKNLFEDESFDITQAIKTINYPTDYTRTNTKSTQATIKRIQSDTRPKTNQSIIVIAHYDKMGMFARGSSSFKLTAELMNNEDLSNYLNILQDTKHDKKNKISESEYEDMIMRNQSIYNFDVIAKYVSLHDVPATFIHDFIINYDSKFEVYTEVIDEKEFVIVCNVEEFKHYFNDYLIPFYKF